MPGGARIVPQDASKHVGHRRGRHRRGQEVETGAAAPFLTAEGLLHGRDERRPAAHFGAERDRLCPIRIVEIEDRRLRHDIRGAEAGGMLGITFNLGRSPHMAFDQNRHCCTAEGNCAREVERPPRNDVFRLTDVGDDGFWGLLGAGPDARQRERGAHQLEEVTASFRIVPFRGLVREFPVQVVAEFRRVSQLAEAAPIQAAVGTGEARFNGSKVHGQLSAFSYQRSGPEGRISADISHGLSSDS